MEKNLQIFTLQHGLSVVSLGGGERRPNAMSLVDKDLQIQRSSKLIQAEYDARRLTWEQAHCLAKVVAYTVDSEDFAEVLTRLLTQD